MRKIKTFTMLLFVLFASNLLKAQVLGYGHSTNTLITDPNISSGLLFTDDTRARVVSTPSFSGINGTLSIDKIHGTFAVGDEVLLIQMKGTHIGLHQNAIVYSYSSGTLTLTSVDLLGFYSGYSTKDMVSTERLQVIKINNYVDFTINSGGTVACHPWVDGDGIGGIVCFAVVHNFTVNGGYITASGLGYTAQESPGVVFRGSNTGELANSKNALSSTSYTSTACAGSAGTVSLSGTAQNGGTATNQTLKGSANSGTGVNYGTPNLNTDFILGTPGYYITTGTPKYGSGYYDAGGGGFGGDGADNPACSTTHASGLTGGVSGRGGAAGIGGNAGGGIYIKALNIIVHTANPVFYAYGADAQYGEDGADGGLGGKGGAGGAGCTGAAPCSTTVKWPGSYGGWGDNGIGGDGGDGGDGGNPGTIWVASPNTIGGSGFSNSNFDVDGGLGGYGGYQGYGGGNFTPGSIYLTNPCDGSRCATTAAAIPCNPDIIMCTLKTCISMSTSGSVYHYPTSTSGTYVEYDYSSGILSLSVASTVIQSVGVLNLTVAFSAFTAFGGIMNTFSGFSGYVSDNGQCGTTNPVTVSWLYPSTALAYANYLRQGNNPYFVIDVAWPAGGNRVYFDRCATSYGPGSGNGGGGGSGWSGGFYSGQPRVRARKGADASNGIIDITGTNHHAKALVLAPSSWSQSAGVANANQSITKLSVYPNPTSGDIWLNLNSISEQTADIIVLDIIGKEVFKQNIKLQKGDNKQLLKLEGIAKGIYSMQLQTTDSKFVQQIIIK